MQERDEELYYAYQDIDELEKIVHKQDITILKQRHSIIIMLIIFGLILVLCIIRIYIKIKTGGFKGLFKKGIFLR